MVDFWFKKRVIKIRGQEDGTVMALLEPLRGLVQPRGLSGSKVVLGLVGAGLGKPAQALCPGLLEPV